MSLPEHTVKRWKKLIEEGATIQRQILEEPRSKEWTRKSTLLMEDHSVEVQSDKSPTTKLLYKQSRSEKHPYNKRVMWINDPMYRFLNFQPDSQIKFHENLG